MFVFIEFEIHSVYIGCGRMHGTTEQSMEAKIENKHR